jgi:hypothetical protein|nr:MAG TPA: hypothetical protein [Caudoviricetes sp.]
MIDLETLESREFDLVGWTIKRHPAFIRIYDAGRAALLTLKKGEVYDNLNDCYIPFSFIRNNLAREVEKEGSLDKREILSNKLDALEYAESLTDKLD